MIDINVCDGHPTSVKSPDTQTREGLNGFDRGRQRLRLLIPPATLASMDSAPPPYSEYRHSVKEGISWNWARIEKYITAERITPKVFFALQVTLALHSRHYGRARREHGAQNFDLTPFENGLWWARTCSIILCIFTESASPLPRLGHLLTDGRSFKTRRVRVFRRI